MDGGSRCVLEDGDRSHGGYAANGHGGWIRCPINGVMDGDGVASHNVVCTYSGVVQTPGVGINSFS